MTQERDRALGMDRAITRRDFVGGSLAAAGALALPGAMPGAAPQDHPGYNPPALHGLRGSHPGSFEVAHSLRDGTFWQHAPAPEPGEVSYDLVVVGGGLSGLAAAYFYRQQRPQARILVLDNHDDFGGHAKRNEFQLGRRLGLINGGTLEIDSPRPYSAVASGLLTALGIDPVVLAKTCTDEDFYEKRGLQDAVFFDRETFGADRLVAGSGAVAWWARLDQAPVTPAVRADMRAIFEGGRPAMHGLSSAQKKMKLSRISYSDYLVKVQRFDPGVLQIMQAITHDEWGVGIDAVSALDCWGFGLPGFAKMGLEPGAAPRMGFTASGYATGGSPKFHFPDGNASIARLIVRALVPAAMPGHGVADIVTAKADYTQLDRKSNKVRIRLSSIAVGVRNGADGTVEVAYSRFGTLQRVRAKGCVLACYNMMIPYLCPEMPTAQKEALHYLVKVPLVYTSVAIRNWRAFQKLGTSEIYAPGSYWVSMWLDRATKIGSFKSVTNQDEPVMVHLTRTPCRPGLDERSQHRAGRAELLATSFEVFERNIRDQMGRTLGPGGFDPAHDIMAITVNRWPHGYAYEYNPLFDPDWAPGQAPHEIGRRPFGRITIANSDSGAGAYTDVAIDQGHRAVRQLLSIEDGKKA